jgi:hypothetical protein
MSSEFHPQNIAFSGVSFCTGGVVPDRGVWLWRVPCPTWRPGQLQVVRAEQRRDGELSKRMQAAENKPACACSELIDPSLAAPGLVLEILD